MKTYLLTFLVLLVLSHTLTAQWTWRNPLPQGNDLHAITILDDGSVWAGGNVGTLMQSANGGVGWNIMNFIDRSKFANIIGVHFPSGSTGFAVDQSGYIYKTTDAGATWDSVYYETDEYLSASCFTDPMNGHIVCSNGKIIRTVDGGVTWQSQYVSPDIWFNTVSFPTQDTGYASGYNYIMKTTDAGATWNVILDDTSRQITGIAFRSATQGFVIGHEGLVMKTTDGGVTWNSQNLGDTVHLSSIGFFSADTILLNGITYGPTSIFSFPVKYRSTDGGGTWIFLPQGPDNRYTTALACQTGGTVFAAGYFGCLEKSVDYGNTWAHLNTYVMSPGHWGDAISGIDFPSVQTGYAVNGGYENQASSVLKTTDGGNTWNCLDSSLANNGMAAIAFVDEQKGYICGTRIYYTADGGNTWLHRVTANTERFRSISFATYLKGVAVGDNGLFFRTADGGQSWAQLAGVPNIYYRAVHFSDDTTGYAAGENTILKTTDAGATWTPVSTYFNLYSLWFTSKNRGFGAGQQGLIIRTTDGGESWDVMNSTTTENLYAIHFYDADTGYVAGGTEVINGFILKTTDGGNTWYKQSVPAASPLYAVRTTGNSAFTGGWNGNFFGTTNGGISVSSGPVAQRPFISAVAYPNPSAGPVTIKYTISGSSDVGIRFLNAYGMNIHEPVMTREGAGTHTCPFPSSGLQPGLYFYQISVNGHTETRKVIITK